jgi:hypothetical protein
MTKFKSKAFEKRKERLKAHYNLYKDYKYIGKLRAEGRMALRGRVKYDVDYVPGQSGKETFKLDFPKGQKSQPHFKGHCQAMGTGDIFNVDAWINTNGNLRFEIYESEGYSAPPF